MLTMALRTIVFGSRVSTLLTRVVGSSASGRSLSNYYPIDEHISGLSEEQKLVIKHYIFMQPAALPIGVWKNYSDKYNWL